MYGHKCFFLEPVNYCLVTGTVLLPEESVGRN